MTTTRSMQGLTKSEARREEIQNEKNVSIVYGEDSTEYNISTVSELIKLLCKHSLMSGRFEVKNSRVYIYN